LDTAAFLHFALSRVQEIDVAFGVKELRGQTKKNLKRRPPFFRYFEYQVSRGKENLPLLTIRISIIRHAF
jgi:hypothetical protein